mmetsp:Transcript_21856/g.35084  ORF Transcript_21856/g.35084 Transcript_21856/m.35084 type:complete len:115 (+) Transcript_21856:2-346(+)
MQTKQDVLEEDEDNGNQLQFANKGETLMGYAAVNTKSQQDEEDEDQEQGDKQMLNTAVTLMGDIHTKEEDNNDENDGNGDSDEEKEIKCNESIPVTMMGACDNEEKLKFTKHKQ